MAKSRHTSLRSLQRYAASGRRRSRRSPQRPTLPADAAKFRRGRSKAAAYKRSTPAINSVRPSANARRKNWSSRPSLKAWVAPQRLWHS
jgi:hypothetical protein